MKDMKDVIVKKLIVSSCIALALSRAKLAGVNAIVMTVKTICMNPKEVKLFLRQYKNTKITTFKNLSVLNKLDATAREVSVCRNIVSASLEDMNACKVVNAKNAKMVR